MKSAVEAAYHLGLGYGSDRLRHRLRLLQRANHNLWKELIKLDKIEPIDAIAIPLAEAQKLIAILRTKRGNLYFARKLQKMVDESVKITNRLNRHFCEELDEG
jgi:hypothetical protein